jgi:uncharacterized protein
MTAQFGMALGLVLVIEGLLYALVPGHLKRMLVAMQDISDDRLRAGGVISVALGVAIVWLMRGASG